MTIRIHQRGGALPDVEAAALGEILVTMHNADTTTDWTRRFPPLDYPDTSAAAEWLDAHPYLCRWVAQVGEEQTVGYIQVGPPAEYLLNGGGGTLPVERMLEIQKLFVCPTMRRHNIGDRLLHEAHSYIVGGGHTPVLTVLAAWTGSVKFYLRNNYTVVNIFEGDQGTNLVMTQPT